MRTRAGLNQSGRVTRGANDARLRRRGAAGTTDLELKGPLVTKRGRLALSHGAGLETGPRGALQVAAGAFVSLVDDRLNVDADKLAEHLAGTRLSTDRNGRMQFKALPPIAALGLTAGGAYTQADMQAVMDKVDELIKLLKDQKAMERGQ